MSKDRSSTSDPASPPAEGRVWSRRRFLQTVAGAGAGVGLVAAGFRLWPGDGEPAPSSGVAASTQTTAVTPATSEQETPTSQVQTREFALSDYAENIQQVIPKDGIPPIDQPVYLAADEVNFLEDSDVVFGLSHEGVTRAYPS